MTSVRERWSMDAYGLSGYLWREGCERWVLRDTTDRPSTGGETPEVENPFVTTLLPLTPSASWSSRGLSDSG